MHTAICKENSKRFIHSLEESPMMEAVNSVMFIEFKDLLSEISISKRVQ